MGQMEKRNAQWRYSQSFRWIPLQGVLEVLNEQGHTIEAKEQERCDVQKAGDDNVLDLPSVGGG